MVTIIHVKQTTHTCETVYTWWNMFLCQTQLTGSNLPAINLLKKLCIHEEALT